MGVWLERYHDFGDSYRLKFRFAFPWAEIYPPTATYLCTRVARRERARYAMPLRKQA